MTPLPPVYLDHNATTPLSTAAREAMAPFLGEEFGNPSSLHGPGLRAARAVARAREAVARLAGARPSEIVFTSSGTEAVAAALLGVLEAHPERRHVVTTTVEHPAVGDLLEALRRAGRIDLERVGVTSDGTADGDGILSRVRDDTALVTVMAANNETGVLLPVEPLAAACAKRGVPFHTDAVQAAGKVPLPASASLLSLAAHKFHGPKGVGVLVVRRGARWKPAPAFAGHQEKGRRGGTENVAGIVGTGVAAAEALTGPSAMDAVAGLRDDLERRILSELPGVRSPAAGAPRTANTSLLLAPGIEGEAVLLQMDMRGVAVSSGSACTAGSLEPSHVLRAMGIPPRDARSAVRFSLSRHTTADEVRRAAGAYVEVVRSLRTLS